MGNSFFKREREIEIKIFLGSVEFFQQKGREGCWRPEHLLLRLRHFERGSPGCPLFHNPPTPLHNEMHSLLELVFIINYYFLFNYLFVCSNLVVNWIGMGVAEALLVRFFPPCSARILPHKAFRHLPPKVLLLQGHLQAAQL